MEKLTVPCTGHQKVGLDVNMASKTLKVRECALEETRRGPIVLTAI